MRKNIRVKVGEEFSDKLLQYAQGQSFGVSFKGSGWGSLGRKNFDSLIYVGVRKSYNGNAFGCGAFIKEYSDYTFVQWNYEVKNQVEQMHSRHTDRIGFPDVTVVIPQWVVELKEGWCNLKWHGEHEAEGFQWMADIDGITADVRNPVHSIGGLNHGLTRELYMDRVEALKMHLRQGNLYQANLCLEFWWENVQIEPGILFSKGFAKMPNPFSVYYTWEGKHCIGFSPERFLAFSGRSVFSQPMKGTAPRGSGADEDERNRQSLLNSEKDRRENVMIVDMVRNDLSHYAAKGSVDVPELYTVETYPRVHQMHSTVTAGLKPGASIMDVLLKAFPMGSMTGAPKVSAMSVIDELENAARGLFSGTIGYITPDGDADFNVVIRSLFYNEHTHVLSTQAGGGITALSDPEAEYGECILKVQPLLEMIADAS